MPFLVGVPIVGGVLSKIVSPVVKALGVYARHSIVNDKNYTPTAKRAPLSHRRWRRNLRRLLRVKLRQTSNSSQAPAKPEIPT